MIYDKISEKINKQSLYMIVSVLLYSLSDAYNKAFVMGTDPFELIFWRSLFETTFLLIALIFVDPSKTYVEKLGSLFKTPYLKLQILRAILGLMSLIFELHSLKTMPLSSHAFINAFAPLLIILISYLILKDRPHSKIWGLLFCGLTSSIIITRIDFDAQFTGVQYALVALLLFAFSTVLTKKCTEDGIFRTLFFYTLISTMCCFLFSSFKLTSTPTDILYFLGLAMLHLAAFFMLVKALSLGPLSQAIPLDYSDILFATLFDYLFFSAIPTFVFWIAVVILLSGKWSYFKK